MTLFDRLAEMFPHAKRQTLKHMVQAGRVTVNGARASKLKASVTAEDAILIDPTVPRVRHPGRATKIESKGGRPIPIFHEDADLLVIDKPAGLITSTVANESRPTALAAVAEYLNWSDRSARIGLIHRLDRDASGLLIFSKNEAAYHSLKDQFFHHTTTRIYNAIAAPPPARPTGTIESKLAEWADGSVHSTRHPLHGKNAITQYKTIEDFGTHALLHVSLETGRKHQIRAHLAELRSPIVGDTVYGGQADNDLGLMLAAVELHVDHPRDGRRLKLNLALPHRLRAFLDRRGNT